MPNRTAKFVSAIFATMLSGTALTTISHGATVAADECLAGPKGQTPAGGHWYYRIERNTKRHCWYLGEEHDKLSQAAPRNASPSENPLSPEAGTAMQQSVANARAELPAQIDRNEVPNPALPANAAGLNDVLRANAPDANAALSVVASRWPEPSSASSASGPTPAAGRLAAIPPANPTAGPSPAVATVTLATADSSSQSRPGSIPTLLVAIVGALALAGTTASLIFKFGRARPPRRGDNRARRAPIRESTDDDRIVVSNYPGFDILRRRPQFFRGPGGANDPNERTAEFFARISGRAPT